MNVDRQSTTPRLLIAGTGYGVGKSVVAAAIAAYRQSSSPFSSQSPSAPLQLSQTSVGTLDLAEAWQSIQAAEPEGLLIEAPGSLGTPVTYETTVADLAWDWRLDTLLVAAVSPQCLGELTAQAALAKQSRCPIQGIILNCNTAEAQAHCETWASPRQVAALTRLPVLGRIPYLSSPTDAQELADAGAELDYGPISKPPCLPAQA